MILVSYGLLMVFTHPAGSECMPIDELTYGYGLSLAFFLTNDQRPGPCGFFLASTCGFFGFLAFYFFFFFNFPFLSSDSSILNLSAGMVVGALLQPQSRLTATATDPSLSLSSLLTS